MQRQIHGSEKIVGEIKLGKLENLSNESLSDSWLLGSQRRDDRYEGKTAFIKHLPEFRNFIRISKPCKLDGDNQSGFQFLLYFKLWKILHLNQFSVFHFN